MVVEGNFPENYKFDEQNKTILGHHDNLKNFGFFSARENNEKKLFSPCKVSIWSRL